MKVSTRSRNLERSLVSFVIRAAFSHHHRCVRYGRYHYFRAWKPNSIVDSILRPYLRSVRRSYGRAMSEIFPFDVYHCMACDFSACSSVLPHRTNHRLSMFLRYSVFRGPYIIEPRTREFSFERHGYSGRRRESLTFQSQAPIFVAIYSQRDRAPSPVTRTRSRSIITIK